MASLIPVRYQANIVEILIVDLRVGGGWKSNNRVSYGYVSVWHSLHMWSLPD